jgi:SAM-dependent methyltransferase
MSDSLSLRFWRKLERIARRKRLRIARDGTSNAPSQPNDAHGWEAVYNQPVEPVNSLSSVIARELETLTQPGETLLEAGCGYGRISAELATVNRRIELCDFSSKILEQAVNLFEASNLDRPKTHVCDLTQPLPFADNSVDCIWSSGVLEHWTDEELQPILNEMKRVSRKRVISLVPYAASFAYRWGKHAAESSGSWPYGRELPRSTQIPAFQRAGLTGVNERPVWADASLGFLEYVDDYTEPAAREWFKTLPDDDPVKIANGYLLLTVGDVD